MRHGKVWYKESSMDDIDELRLNWQYENYHYCLSQHLFGLLNPAITQYPEIVLKFVPFFLVIDWNLQLRMKFTVT